MRNVTQEKKKGKGLKEVETRLVEQSNQSSAVRLLITRTTLSATLPSFKTDPRWGGREKGRRSSLLRDVIELREEDLFFLVDE